MKTELAEQSVEKLQSDNRVQEARIGENEKGVYVRAIATDQMAARELRSDLGPYPIYVDVVSP